MPLTGSNKNLWYADANAPMSVNTISAVEATSVGNAIEDLYLQSVIKVANSTKRDEIFPDPKQGDAVWRLDRGWEERWFDTYSSKTNTAGKPAAGWYRVNSGPSASYNLGTFTFNTASATYDLNNIFVADSNIGSFQFYELKYSFIGSVSANLIMRFWSGGSLISSPLYNYTYITGSGAGQTSATSSANTLYNLSPSTVNGTIHSGTILFSDMVSKNLPKINVNSYCYSSTGPTMTGTIMAGYYNSTTTAFDGIRFNAGGAFSGTISIMGYN